MAVVIFDVSGRLLEVKGKMKERGYYDFWVDNGTTYYLPSTTLWKEGITVAAAKADIQAVAEQLSVRLHRALALDVHPWDAIPGDPQN